MKQVKLFTLVVLLLFCITGNTIPNTLLDTTTQNMGQVLSISVIRDCTKLPVWTIIVYTNGMKFYYVADEEDLSIFDDPIINNVYTPQDTCI